MKDGWIQRHGMRYPLPIYEKVVKRSGFLGLAIIVTDLIPFRYKCYVAAGYKVPDEYEKIVWGFGASRAKKWCESKLEEGKECQN